MSYGKCFTTHHCRWGYRGHRVKQRWLAGSWLYQGWWLQASPRQHHSRADRSLQQQSPLWEKYWKCRLMPLLVLYPSQLRTTNVLRATGSLWCRMWLAKPGKDSSQKIHPPYWMCPPTRYGCLPSSQRDLDQSSHCGSKHLGQLWGKGQHLVGRTWLGGCLQPRPANHLGWSNAAAWHLSLLGPVGHVCTQRQKMHDEAADMALWLDSHQHWTSSGLSSVPSPLQYLPSPSGQTQPTALQAENLCWRHLGQLQG